MTAGYRYVLCVSLERTVDYGKLSLESHLHFHCVFTFHQHLTKKKICSYTLSVNNKRLCILHVLLCTHVTKLTFFFKLMQAVCLIQYVAPA